MLNIHVSSQNLVNLWGHNYIYIDFYDDHILTYLCLDNPQYNIQIRRRREHYFFHSCPKVFLVASLSNHCFELKFSKFRQTQSRTIQRG